MTAEVGKRETGEKEEKKKPTSIWEHRNDEFSVLFSWYYFVVCLSSTKTYISTVSGLNIIVTGEKKHMGSLWD